MRFTTRLITTAMLAALGSAALAQEATQDSTWVTPSTKSRADVRAETQAALRDGTLPRTEASYTVAPSASGSKLTRAQVMAEAREAARLGLIPIHEGNMRFATPAENEQIRQAGLRARDAESQFAAK